MNLKRRTFIAGLAGLAASRPARALASGGFRLGLTPVFLDNDATLLEVMGRSLSEALGFSVSFEQRRTYEEVTGLLLQGAVDAAWLCGFPYLQHKEELEVLAVPVWHGRPLYQSYLIVGDSDPAERLEDLRGDIHAFSDPDSNSGYLVTVTDLIRKGESPASFFERTVFTYGHRNVVRSVAAGLTRSGSVDGYVWEALLRQEPELTGRTRVIQRSEWLGFPPVCARRDHMDQPRVQAFRDALLTLGEHGSGRRTLDLLQLDGLTPAKSGLFDGIAARIRDLDRLR